MEGEIVWRKNQYMLQYFADGDEHLIPVHVGDTVEVLLNDAWVKTTVGMRMGEPHFMDINYGDGIGCIGRIFDTEHNQ